MTRALHTVNPDLPPYLEWDKFVRNFRWRQGEHVALLGHTGCGKSTFAQALLPLRKYVVVLATKPRDDTLNKFGEAYDYKVLPEWDKRLHPRKAPRRILWPDARSLYAAKEQQRVFRDALEDIYTQGGWCVYCDEGWIMTQTLKMGHEIKTFLQQGRSLDISFVLATQRPAWIPLEVYDQSTHLFFWADNDEANLRRISGIGSMPTQLIRDTVQVLGPHECLYINTRDRVMGRTKAPANLTVIRG